MNPGTTLFIITGVIGLLLYISKSLKPTLYENFTTLGKDDVSNKGANALSDLQNGTTNFEALMNAFSTPDLNMRPTNKSYQSPQLSDFIKKPELTPVSIDTKPPTNNIPVRAPASILSVQQPENKSTPITLSDTQGLLLKNNVANSNVQPPLPLLPPLPLPKPLVEQQIEPQQILSQQPIIVPVNTEPIRSSKKKKSRNCQRNSPGYTSVAEKIVYVPRKCPPLPDMSLYIRKDSIPCWGCNLK